MDNCVDVTSKLSGAELRKQKLMDYLAAKGRLKPPNPKPYLRVRNEIKLKKFTGTIQRSDFMNKGKENHAPNPSTLKKEVTKKPALTEPTKRVSQPTLSSRGTAKAALKTLPVTSAPTHRHTAPEGPRNPSPIQTASLAVDPARTCSSLTVNVRNVPNSTEPARSQLNTAVKAKNGPKIVQSIKTHPAATSTASAPNRAHSNTAAIPKRLAVVQNKLDLVTADAKPLTRTVSAARQPRSHALSRAEAKPATCKTTKTIGPRQAAGVSKLTNSLSSHRVIVKPDGDKDQRKTFRGLTQPSNAVKRAPQTRPGGSQSTRWGVLPRASTSQIDGTRSKPHVPNPTKTAPGAATKLGGRGLLLAASKRAGAPAVPPPASSGVLATGGNVTEEPRPAAVKRLVPSAAMPLCAAGFVSSARSAALPSAAQTVLPRPVKNAGQLGRNMEPKTSRPAGRPEHQAARTAPPQDRKAPTAAQEERLQKLKEWREAKGISYKRPPMPVRQRVRRTLALPERYWAAMEEEDEVHSLVCAVDRSLADCIKLLQEGCCSAQVREVLSRVPMAQKFSKYWICQARLMERDGDLGVLPMFEEAVRVVREPVDDLRAVVFDILKKKEAQAQRLNPETGRDECPQEAEDQQPLDEALTTPRAVGALIRGAKGDSSVVKYKITATPGGRRSQQQEPVRLDGQEVRFFTPVRRSVRIERSALRYPVALQEHDPCVVSFRDLLAEEEGEGSLTPSRNSPLYIYRENEALKEQVHLQLVHSEERDT